MSFALRGVVPVGGNVGGGVFERFIKVANHVPTPGNIAAKMSGLNVGLIGEARAQDAVKGVGNDESNAYQVGKKFGESASTGLPDIPDIVGYIKATAGHRDWIEENKGRIIESRQDLSPTHKAYLTGVLDGRVRATPKTAGTLGVTVTVAAAVAAAIASRVPQALLPVLGIAFFSLDNPSPIKHLSRGHEYNNKFITSHVEKFNQLVTQADAHIARDPVEANNWIREKDKEIKSLAAEIAGQILVKMHENDFQFRAFELKNKGVLPDSRTGRILPSKREAFEKEANKLTELLVDVLVRSY